MVLKIIAPRWDIGRNLRYVFTGRIVFCHRIYHFLAIVVGRNVNIPILLFGKRMSENSLSKTSPNQHYLNASWLLKLRWVAVIQNSDSDVLGDGCRHFFDSILKSFSYVLVQALAED
jgi:hypothetical protein